MPENNYPIRNKDGEVGNDRRIRDRRRDQTIEEVIRQQDDYLRIQQEEVEKGAPVSVTTVSNKASQKEFIQTKQEVRDRVEEDKTELPKETRRKKRRTNRRNTGLTTDADNNVISVSEAVKDTDVTPPSVIEDEVSENEDDENNTSDADSKDDTEN